MKTRADALSVFSNRARYPSAIRDAINAARSLIIMDRTSDNKSGARAGLAKQPARQRLHQNGEKEARHNISHGLREVVHDERCVMSERPHSPVLPFPGGGPEFAPDPVQEI